MPQNDPYGFTLLDSAYFEAEVPPKSHSKFQERYHKATGYNVTPGHPSEYQSQPNKRGIECRIYFNSHIVACTAKSLGFNVHSGHPYKNAYQYRINNNDLWWDLVENYGFHLGVN